MTTTRKSYPSDVTDGEWEFLVPYLSLMREDAPQREHSLRTVFNALRYMVRTGCQWRYLPNDFPPWEAVYQQARRWMQAGVFEILAHDLRIIMRVLADRDESPSAVIVDARTLQSTPESGGRAGYDGAKKKNDSKVHAAVDTLGNLLTLTITAANEQERSQVGELAEQVQQVTGGTVEVAYADQGYTGETVAADADKHSIELEIVKHTEAKRGFVLLPKRWVVERTFGWLDRFRRLARDYERLAEPLKHYHWLAFLGLLLARLGLGSAKQALSVQTLCRALQQLCLHLKKVLKATELLRPDVDQRRLLWSLLQVGLDPKWLVFFDETWAKTNMTRPRGRALQGQRLVCHAPFGHWKTTTFFAGLRLSGLTAPLVIDGALNGAVFVSYLQQHLAPTLNAGDILIMDILASHKVPGVREAV